MSTSSSVHGQIGCTLSAKLALSSPWLVLSYGLVPYGLTSSELLWAGCGIMSNIPYLSAQPDFKLAFTSLATSFKLSLELSARICYIGIYVSSSLIPADIKIMGSTRHRLNELCSTKIDGCQRSKHKRLFFSAGGSHYKRLDGSRSFDVSIRTNRPILRQSRCV